VSPIPWCPGFLGVLDSFRWRLWVPWISELAASAWVSRSFIGDVLGFLEVTSMGVLVISEVNRITGKASVARLSRSAGMKQVTARCQFRGQCKPCKIWRLCELPGQNELPRQALDGLGQTQKFGELQCRNEKPGRHGRRDDSTTLPILRFTHSLTPRFTDSPIH
jgi:hypothetical protein